MPGMTFKARRIWLEGNFKPSSRVSVDDVQVAEESGTDLAQAVRRRLRVKEKQAGGSSTAGVRPAGPCRSIRQKLRSRSGP